jgi:DNA-binding NarL/FixJ family response regulator
MTLLGQIRAVYSSGTIHRDPGAGSADAWGTYGLSKRETQVCGLIFEGKTVAEMAQALYLTESTVKQHITHILKKTGMPNRAELRARISPPR